MVVGQLLLRGLVVFCLVFWSQDFPQRLCIDGGCDELKY